MVNQYFCTSQSFDFIKGYFRNEWANCLLRNGLISSSLSEELWKNREQISDRISLWNHLTKKKTSFFCASWKFLQCIRILVSRSRNFLCVIVATQKNFNAFPLLLKYVWDNTWFWLDALLWKIGLKERVRIFKWYVDLKGGFFTTVSIF